MSDSLKTGLAARRVFRRVRAKIRNLQPMVVVRARECLHMIVMEKGFAPFFGSGLGINDNKKSVYQRGRSSKFRGLNH